jgi:hypothetical protein
VEEKLSSLTRQKIRSLTRHMVLGRVAAACGIDETKFSRVLNPDAPTNAYLYPPEIFRLARELGTTVEYLCDDSVPDAHAPEAEPMQYKRRRRYQPTRPKNDPESSAAQHNPVERKRSGTR